MAERLAGCVVEGRPLNHRKRSSKWRLYGKSVRQQLAEYCLTSILTQRQEPLRSRPWVKNLTVSSGCAPCKGGAFQWVKVPPGEMLQPEATGAAMEVTKWLKPSDSGPQNSVAARVCRP